MKYSLMAAVLFLAACNSGTTDDLLRNKRWKVYDVSVPRGTDYNHSQITQLKDLKNGYYSDANYQFLDNQLFIATVAGHPDSGRYQLLSNGRIISVTGFSGNRKAEHLVEVVKLTETEFDMKVQAGEFQFILHTRKQ
ncbi:hypothetical protein ACWKWU_02305 [Chitinophaga lutea]